MDTINKGIDDKLFAYIRDSIQGTAYYNLLSVELQCLGQGYAEFRTISESKHMNPLGVVHGGMIMTLADAAMGNAVRSLGVTGVSTDFSVSLLAAAPQGVEVVSKGKVIKQGRNLLFAHAQVFAGVRWLPTVKGLSIK
jgi:acyl-CoA thioesterase